MLARIDKYFILELQEKGYDLDYKKLTTIYRSSREREDFKKSIRHNYVNKKMAEELFSNYIP